MVGFSLIDSIVSRALGVTTVGAVALALGTTAHAQTPGSAPTVEAAAAAAPASPTASTGGTPDATLGEVTVSASRLTTAGFSAPTPTEVLGTQQLQQIAEPNVAATVQQLPALSGSPSTQSGNGGTSSGLNGLTELNLRSLGTDRTLVLIDGQRIAPAFIDGTVDISLLPQLLIQRVDVVTGGVSASYGSDAVAGVVNFVTNTHFTGFETNVEGGITNYGDDRSGLVQLAWGTAGLDDHLHIEASGEYYDDLGVPARNPGDNGGPDGRMWYQTPVLVTRSPTATPAGQPEDFLYTNTQYTSYGPYGLITGGPLKGTAFGAGGAPYAFQYGTNCIGSNCTGGDLTEDVQNTADLDSPLRRGVFYGRIGYDLADNIQLYSTISYAGVRTFDQPNAGAAEQGNLTIQCSNPYVPASIAAACGTDGITSFPLGSTNLDFPQYIQIQTNRTQARYVLGLNANDLTIFNKPWTLQAYAEYGDTHSDININNMMLLPRYQAALSATTSNGQIVCSSAAARAAGCVPFDVLGDVPINPASWSYIAPGDGPFEDMYITEEAGDVSLSGAPLQGWAGPVSVALGGEWREEYYQNVADPYGAGVSASSPYDSSYPADPVLSTSGNNWYAGNFHDGTGLFNVREGFLEIGLPLFNTPTLGKFDADLAGRETEYSTAGSVFTWKLGGVWDTPLQGIRLRAVRSQDIRAPNLQDLYAPATTLSNAGIINRLTGQTVTALQTTLGNPDLKPEIAQNLEAGIVIQPSWLHGLQASWDYFYINISGAVETLTAQEQVDLCQISGNASACKNVNFTATGAAGLTNSVILQPFNAATITTDGFDIAASYPVDLRRLGLPGNLAISAQATHVRKFLENTAISGQPILNYAGANDNISGTTNFGVVPNWKGTLTEAWTGEQLGLSLIQRFVSAGLINPDYLQCSPGTCPLPTIQTPTINDNVIPGAVYLDLAAFYKVGAHGQVYLKVDNTLNHDPPNLASPELYDYLGRVYRLGFRFSE